MIPWVLSLVVVLLIGVIVYQEYFFTKQIQKLVDKLMSRDFTQYQATIAPPPPRVQLPAGVPDDLNALKDFSPL